MKDSITFMKPFELIALSNGDNKVKCSSVFMLAFATSERVNLFFDINSRYLSKNNKTYQKMPTGA